MNIPQHIAIILDGNGRWAKKKGMPRNFGHTQGSKNVERICEDAYKMGVKYLTVYAFSTENWKRPKEEVDALMNLLRNYMKTCLKTAEKNRMRVRVLGDKTALDDDIRNRIAELEQATKNNDGLNFQIALNYGSRDEMVRAMKKMCMDCRDGKLEAEQIDEKLFENSFMEDYPESELPRGWFRCIGWCRLYRRRWRYGWCWRYGRRRRIRRYRRRTDGRCGSGRRSRIFCRCNTLRRCLRHRRNSCLLRCLCRFSPHFRIAACKQ